MENCPYCKSHKFKKKYQIEQCKILICHECDLMWLYPQLTVEELEEVYTEDYFLNKKFENNEPNNIYGYTDYMSERINKQKKYKKIIQNIKCNYPNLNNNWLDIGCGLGFLLEEANKEKFEVEGVEFNKYAIKYIKDKYNFNVYEDDIEKIENRYDVISMLDVIEHLQNPFEELDKVYKKLNQDGVLIISTMDSTSLVCRILGTRIEDFRRIREHLFFFSRKSLTTILEEKKFKVDRIESIGHTFKLEQLLTRIGMMFPFFQKIMSIVWLPEFILGMNIHIDPKTKMIMYVSKK